MNYWKKCSSCKSEIGFRTPFYKCSVSTCNGKRTGYVFCSIPCWERHLPGARHRDAAAIEEISPAAAPASHAPTASSTSASTSSSADASPKRRIVSQPASASPTPSKSASSHEILVVVSKFKAYIKDSADMNTAQECMSVLSDFLRLQADRAIENARADGRKTVMARDFRD